MTGDPESANEIAPAGEASDRFVGNVESGQPAGGPDDLGRQAAERSEDDAPPDAMGEGIDAHGSGIARDACPYAEGNENRERWFEGWDRQSLKGEDI